MVCPNTVCNRDEGILVGVTIPSCFANGNALTGNGDEVKRVSDVTLPGVQVFS